MKNNILDKIIDIKFLYAIVIVSAIIGFIVKENGIPSFNSMLEAESNKYNNSKTRDIYYWDIKDKLYSTGSLFSRMKAVYRKKSSGDCCIVKRKGTDNSFEYDMRIDTNRFISYEAQILKRMCINENSRGDYVDFCKKVEIQIYNINTQKVEKKVDVLTEIKKLIENTDFQSDVRKKLVESSQKDKDGILVKGEFQNPIICADKSGKRIMVFEIPKQLDCKTIDSFEYFAYYIDEDQMKKISFDELPDRIKDSGSNELKDKESIESGDDSSLNKKNDKLVLKTQLAQSALKTQTQERNSYCLKNYMDKSAFETLLDSNKIKYRATYLSDVAKTPVHIKMLGSDLDKSSKLAKKFPELAKKYASDDYVIDWYAGDEKNSDEIAKQLLPKGKKLNYDTVHVGDDCAKNLKNASVDSLKDYYKKVKPECILDGRKK